MTQGSSNEFCWLVIFNVTFSSVSQQNFFMDPASAAPRTFACSVGIADIRPAKVRLGLRPSLRMTDGRSVSANSFVCSDRGRRSLQVCANKVYFPVKMLLSRSRSEQFTAQQFRLPLGVPKNLRKLSAVSAQS